MKTPAQIEYEVRCAYDMAKRNGFGLEIGSTIEIIAGKEPYNLGARIASLSDFNAVIAWFSGYEKKNSR